MRCNVLISLTFRCDIGQRRPNRGHADTDILMEGYMAVCHNGRPNQQRQPIRVRRVAPNMHGQARVDLEEIWTQACASTRLATTHHPVYTHKIPERRVSLSSIRAYCSRSVQMDLQTLSNLFATTLNPNPNVRKAGELDIRKVHLFP